jgi:hypothetical protein
METYTGHSSGKDNNTNSSADTEKGTMSTVQMPAVPALQKAQDPPPQENETNEEETFQKPFVPVQTKERAPLQLKSKNDSTSGAFKPVQRKENKTGLPDNLKSGVESLSGTNLSDVKVHYGSSQPAQFNAYAYAQGTEIHIAPGQEQHLPHEAWHVAQQKQGRVQATTQMKGTGVNDDLSLEKEADDMGARAMNTSFDSLASGNEHLNGEDIGDVKARSSLVSNVQRQTFDQINREISLPAAGKQHIAQLVAGKILVDDGEPLKDGQIHKSSFLASLRAEIQQVSKEVLEPVGLAHADCPDLNYWIGFYETKNAAYFEAAVARYAPATAEAANSTEYLASLSERIRAGLVHHVETGENTVDPAKVPADVEEKRPERPVQFKIFGTKKGPDKPPEQKAVAKAPGKSAVEEKKVMNRPLAARDRKESEENTISVVRARAAELRRLYQAGDHKGIGAILYESDIEIVKRTFRGNPEAYISDQLNGCSGAAAAIAMYVIGKDTQPVMGSSPLVLLKRADAAGESKAPAAYVLSDAFSKLLDGYGDGHYYFAKIEGSGGHHFTIIRMDGAYDFYESDENLPTAQAINFLQPDNPRIKPPQSGTAISKDALAAKLLPMTQRGVLGNALGTYSYTFKPMSTVT